MAKFKVSLELTGLKLNIEGERDDVPLITENIGAQIAGMLRPAANIVEGEEPDEARRVVVNQAAAQNVLDASKGGKKRRTPKRGGNGSGTSTASDAPIIALTHDAEKFGFPDQEWGGIDKAIWLLYVVESQTDVKDLATPQMAQLFEKHFREAKAPGASHLTTYLSRAKSRKPPPVADTNVADQQRWYLTTKGKEEARKLIASRTEPLLNTNANGAA